MTPQEQQMLDGLIERIRNTQLPNKDGDADRRIQDALGRDPNALYVLCQTVLVQGYALEQAQKQLADVKQQQGNMSQQEEHHTSFLEKIFGKADPEPPAPQNVQGTAYGEPVYSGGQINTNQAQYGQPGYTRPGYGQQVPQAYPPPVVYPMQPGYGTPYAAYGAGAPGMFGGGGGGFLQGALQTAAGVAMGEMAFQGIESLFRGFGHAAGYGSDRAMGFGDMGSGDDRRDFGSGDGFFSREQAENGVNDQLSSDIEDRRGDAQGFLGSDSDESRDGFMGGDDSLNGQDGSDFADTSVDDSGSFDDSGSLDDGSSFSDDNS